MYPIDIFSDQKMLKAMVCLAALFYSVAAFAQDNSIKIKKEKPCDCKLVIDDPSIENDTTFVFLVGVEGIYPDSILNNRSYRLIISPSEKMVINETGFFMVKQQACRIKNFSLKEIHARKMVKGITYVTLKYKKTRP